VQTLEPGEALEAGLKVDSQALPRAVIQAIQAGQVSLTDPAVTRLLLSLDAVVHAQRHDVPGRDSAGVRIARRAL
jgi:hypothetical protein